MRDQANDFERKLARAKVEERKVAAYLKALGYRVLPTTDFSGSGAPMLEAENENESLVMPDLQAFRGGAGAWFEVKWKSEATWYERHKRFETGVSQRHFEHYCRIERETKTPVVIVFVHEAEREVRCATLAQLASAFSHDYHGDKMGKSGMRFWIYDRIPLWMPLGELSAAIEAHRLGAKLIEPAIPPPIGSDVMQASHALQKHAQNAPSPHGVFGRSMPTFTKVPESSSRDACSKCGDSANGKAFFVTFTVRDSAGERVVCSRCWRELSKEGLVVA